MYDEDLSYLPWRPLMCLVEIKNGSLDFIEKYEIYAKIEKNELFNVWC